MKIVNIGRKEDNDHANQKIKKIYNQGDIIISYPGLSNEIYQFKMKPNYLNEKLYKVHHQSKSLGINNNSSKKNKKYKTIKDQVEEMYNKIQQEIDEVDSDEEYKKNIGYILKDFFTDEELLDNTKISPNPIKNLINSIIQKNEKEEIKPYIPNLQVNKEKRILYKPKIYNNNNLKLNKNNHQEDKQQKKKEVNLQKIIDIYKDNEKIIKKINELYSRFLREEKKREEKKRKKDLKQMINNRKIKQEDNSLENIKEDEKGEKSISDSEQNIVNNIIKKDKSEEKELHKKKYFFEKKDLVKIIDISKDKKYIEAKKHLKRSKENYEKTNELIMEINHKIKEDKNSIRNSDYKLNKKPQIELEKKVKEIIEKVHLDIHFSYEQLKNDSNNNN